MMHVISLPLQFNLSDSTFILIHFYCPNLSHLNREASSRYMQLWEGKHESGQWIEIEAAEALSYRSEFPPMNTSGIIFSEDAMKQKESIEAWPASVGDVGIENNGNATSQESGKKNQFIVVNFAPT